MNLNECTRQMLCSDKTFHLLQSENAVFFALSAVIVWKMKVSLEKSACFILCRFLRKKIYSNTLILEFSFVLIPSIENID